MALLSLDDRTVDLWCVPLGQASDMRLLEQYRRLLSPDELARESRFVAIGARLQYLVGRALVRLVLSRYVKSDPKEWRFSYSRFGKPAVHLPGGSSLEFNLSHTEGVVVCAVGGSRAVGVDVEKQDRRPDALHLARRFFAPPEAEALASLPPEKAQRRFLEFWTLKEAWIKARGTGLSMPLDCFAFTLASGRPPAIEFLKDCGEDPHCWQFVQIDLQGSHHLGLAVHQEASRPIKLRMWETVPLVAESSPVFLPDSPEHRWTWKGGGVCEPIQG